MLPLTVLPGKSKDQITLIFRLGSWLNKAFNAKYLANLRSNGLAFKCEEV